MSNCSVALPTMNELLEKTRLMSKQAQKVAENKKKKRLKDYRIKFANKPQGKNQKKRMKVKLHRRLKHTRKDF